MDWNGGIVSSNPKLRKALNDSELPYIARLLERLERSRGKGEGRMLVAFGAQGMEAGSQ